MSSSFHLERFVAAQNPDYGDILAELRAGHKTSHWMWYVFPQIKGLGLSETSLHFAISSLEEAQAYLAHPILGPRLLECTELVNQTQNRSAEKIFGSIDALKFRSSMTLFAQAAASTPNLFQTALAKYFEAQPHPRTLELLAQFEKTNPLGSKRKTAS